MKFPVTTTPFRRPATLLWLVLALLSTAALHAQTNFRFRVVAANLTSGSQQSYEPPGLRILEGMEADIVAIQEFNYLNDAPSDIRTLVDATFGTNFVYYRESGYSIPNGIISRWPILQSGSWVDSDEGVNDRGFAWAQIDLPGTNDLYVVSVHFKASSGGENVARRAAQADEVKSLITSNFPAGAWVIVAGDFNLHSESEAGIQTLKTFLTDAPVPVDGNGDPDTNAGRSERYDRILPSFSLTDNLTNVVFASQSFANGLVFDSRVYTPLTDVEPAQSGDSGVSGMQHMAVVKEFYAVEEGGSSPPTVPAITDQPDSLAVTEGNKAAFLVTATGDDPLSFQWRFNDSEIPGANGTIYTRVSAQLSDAGNYSVVVTNNAGSITSAVAVLTVNSPGTNTYSGVLAGWDVSAQSAFGISPLDPSTNASDVTVVGLTRGSGVTTTPTGAGRAWGGNGFDAADLSTAASNNDFAYVALSANAGFEVSFESISRLDYRRSSSGPSTGTLQYQVGSGAFIDIAGLSYTSTSSGGASLDPVDLSSIPALQNVGPGTNITFRFVNYGATSSGGTWYIFDVANSTAPDLAISGTITPVVTTPPTPATLSNPAYVDGNLQFQLTGQAGALYVVQATTNLLSTNWVPVITNTAPFLYAETNLPTVPIRFFRAIAPE